MEFNQVGGAYKQPWSRQRRGLLIFLLDQSGSMSDPVQGKPYTNRDMATAVLNDLIVSVIQNAPNDAQTNRRRNYCDMLVLGYGDQVTPLLNKTGMPVSLPDLAEHPRGWHTVLVNNVQEDRPFWIEPFATSYKTEMAEALSRASQAIQEWVNTDRKRYLSFPPVVINITDGQHNGKGDPIVEAKRLRQLRTDDGPVLLFNCHLTINNSRKLSFPHDIGQIQTLGLSQIEQEGAKQLFAMSSIVPPSMVSRADQVFRRTLSQGARGFMYNASGQDLINFLTWGTRQSREFVV